MQTCAHAHTYVCVCGVSCRWTEEAIGEDPQLVSVLGEAYALGMMGGPDGRPQYLQRRHRGQALCRVRVRGPGRVPQGRLGPHSV